MTLLSSYAVAYQEYLTQSCPQLPKDTRAMIEISLEQTNWEEPTSIKDFNSIGVVALLMAEQSQDFDIRAMYFEMALEAFQEGVQASPLCIAHLALMKSMIGEREEAIQLAFSTLIELSSLDSSHEASEGMASEIELIYVPPFSSSVLTGRSEVLLTGLTVEPVYEQAKILCIETLRRSQLVFYSPAGLRFLQIATQLLPQSAFMNLGLGLASLLNNQWEGVIYLHRAQKIVPNYSSSYQALSLAYRDLKKPELSLKYWNLAQQQENESDQRSWFWAQHPHDAPFTYVPFGQNTILCVEANFRSLVTSVLIAEGDWFEHEIEFWRNQLKPGMTVIDVGANVGVYTFSAAEKVGSSGKVIAVEPFPTCVKAMNETAVINSISWVSICEGAASNRNGTAQLGVHESSELNEIIADDSNIPSEHRIIVPCFTLDSLIEQQGVKTVDWLKIDAEGHEIQVLKGAEYIIDSFAPGILYENIAASNASNVEVAEYLVNKGYTLFRYQPFLGNLIPIESIESLTGNLNIIALHQNNT